MIPTASRQYQQRSCKMLPSFFQLVPPLSAKAAFLSLLWLTLLILNSSLPNIEIYCVLGLGLYLSRITPPLLTTTASVLSHKPSAKPQPASVCFSPEAELEATCSRRKRALYFLTLLHPQEGASCQLLQSEW